MGAGRASARACYVASFLPGLRHLKECLDRSTITDTQSLDEFIGDGQGLFRDLLEACHTGDKKSMPSSKELGWWESEALRLCRQLAGIDHQWFRSWSGPSDKGPLVESERGAYL